MVNFEVYWVLVILYFVAALLPLPLLYLTIPNYTSRGGPALVALIIGLGVWAFSGALQLAVPTLAVKVYFLKLSTIGFTITPVAWFIFALEYTQTEVPHKSIIYSSLAGLAGLINIFASTNELHYLFWKGYSLTSINGNILLVQDYGILFYLFTAYHIILAATALGILFAYGATRGTTYQAHVRLLGVSVSFIVSSLFITIGGFTPFNGNLDVVPLGILVANVSLLIAVTRFDLLTLSPTERDQLLYEEAGIREAETLLQDNPDLDPVNIGEIAEYTAEIFYEAHEHTGNDVDIKIDCDIKTQASENLLERLFTSLFENAAEHNELPVTVHIGELIFDDGFFVEDNGKGIPDSYKNTVIEPGVAFDGDGSGAGLAVVERISTGHGWTLNITDSAEGGARFEFTGIEKIEPDD